MAYLGRISAVLTANTRDFTRQIGTARRELQDFARQARGTQLNLDNRALNGTLTNLQRFQRTLQEIQRLQNAGIDAGLPDARRLRDQFRLFEDLGRPLTDVKNRIEGLSNAIQSELYPELGRVQQGFRNLYRQIGEGATSFDQSAARIDNLRQRLIGLSRATAALSDLNSLTRQLNSNNAGASFFTPRAQEALQQSIRLRGQAQALPSRFRENGAFADLAVQAEENAERVERAAARVARAQLRVINEGENPATLANRSRAQSELDILTRQQRGINLGFEREIASAQIQQIVSPEAPRQADRLIERLKSLASELRAIDGKQFNGLIASTAAVVDQFNRGEISANRARAAVDKLAKSLEAAGRVQAGRQIGRDLQEQADQLLFSERERRQRKIQSAFDTATANVPAGDPRRRRAELDRDITLRRDQLVSEIIPRTTGLADQARQTGDQQAIRSAAELLQVNRQINNELTKSANLAEQNKYDESEASLRRVNSLLQRQSELEGDIAGRVDISNAARRQTQLFLEQSGGLGEQLSQGARDAASDISVGRQFRGGIRDGGSRIAIANEISRIEASVEGLQRRMAAVAASDLGADEKIAELNRLDNEVRESTSGLAEFIAAQAQAAAAAEGGVAPYSAAQIQAAMDRGKNNAGSIGIGGGAAAQLAFQQGLFAIDDFVSSTGGVEYKLRAIGNNITQLGLLLGQSGLIPGLTATTGLFVSLGAVLAGQAAVAIYKWINGATTAEDQTKSLNDALARQKSLVEELAQAFESIGDAIANRAFSEPAQQARRFAKELDDVAKKQKELRESRAADLDPEVNRERDQQNRLRRELESETNVEARIAKQRLIAASVARERAAAAAAAGRSVNVGEAQAGLRSAGAAISRFTFNEQFPAIGRRISESANDATNPLSAAAAIRQAIDSLSPAAQRRDLLGNRTPVAEEAEAQILRLSQLLASLELPLQKALDELSNSIIRASQAASLEIESAQADVADAVRRGVPGAALLQQNLDAIADEMDAAQTRLRDAQKIEDPNEREQQIRLAQRDIDGIRAREDAIAEASRDIRLTSGRGGERTTAALSALQGNERFANEYGGLIARLRAAVDAEMVARLANEKAMKGGTDAEKEAARAAYESAAAVSDMAAAAAEAALAMEQAVGRIRKIGADALSQSERMADEAQQRFNERPTDENRQRRDDAERQLIRDRERVARANNALDRRRTELQQSDPRLVQIGDELESIRQERLRLSDDAAKNNTTVDPAEAERLANREAQLLAEREERLFNLTEAERRQQEAIDREIAARRRLVDFMEEVERRQNPQGDPVRGLDLLERPGERAARELRQSVADIRAATKQNIDRAIREGRPQDVDREWQRGREAERRALLDQVRNAAPTIFGLADSVANAVLQGPSRAALQATDVSTVEGSRELTRLLRGDDAARDQANLVELQREANRLLDIIANAPAPVAN